MNSFVMYIYDFIRYVGLTYSKSMLYQFNANNPFQVLIFSPFKFFSLACVNNPSGQFFFYNNLFLYSHQFSEENFNFYHFTFKIASTK